MSPQQQLTTATLDPVPARHVEDIPVAEEMSDSFLAYALSVITSRAIPDVRDGLKPVQRRVLYSMLQMGLRPGTPYRKSARVVGDTMGRYHPHGDAAIYDTLVRMGQDFSRMVSLVDPQGNFGSLDDPPAASRYTECRLSDAAMDLVGELDEDTVDFRPTYDGEDTEPAVLPAALPNLLVNGTAGIAVGMATNMVPHNLAEVGEAIELVMSKQPDGGRSRVGPRDGPQASAAADCRGADGGPRWTRLPRRRDRADRRRPPGGLRDRPRIGQGSGPDRSRVGHPPASGGHRDGAALSGGSRAGGLADHRAGRGRTAPRRVRRRRPERHGRTAPADRPEARRRRRGRAGGPLPVHTPGGDAERQQRGAGGRRPHHRRAPGSVRALRGSPACGRRAPHRVIGCGERTSACTSWRA